MFGSSLCYTCQGYIHEDHHALAVLQNQVPLTAGQHWKRQVKSSADISLTCTQQLWTCGDTWDCFCLNSCCVDVKTGWVLTADIVVLMHCRLSGEEGVDPCNQPKRLKPNWFWWKTQQCMSVLTEPGRLFWVVLVVCFSGDIWQHWCSRHTNLINQKKHKRLLSLSCLHWRYTSHPPSCCSVTTSCRTDVWLIHSITN